MEWGDAFGCGVRKGRHMCDWMGVTEGCTGGVVHVPQEGSNAVRWQHMCEAVVVVVVVVQLPRRATRPPLLCVCDFIGPYRVAPCLSAVTQLAHFRSILPFFENHPQSDLCERPTTGPTKRADYRAD